MKNIITLRFKTAPAEGREAIKDNRNECRSMGFLCYNYFTNLGIGKENHTLLFPNCPLADPLSLPGTLSTLLYQALSPLSLPSPLSTLFTKPQLGKA